MAHKWIAQVLLVGYVAAWPGGQLLHWVSGCPHHLTGHSRIAAEARPTSCHHQGCRHAAAVREGFARKKAGGRSVLTVRAPRPGADHRQSACPFARFQFKTPSPDVIPISAGAPDRVQSLVRAFSGIPCPRAISSYRPRAPPAIAPPIC